MFVHIQSTKKQSNENMTTEFSGVTYPWSCLCVSSMLLNAHNCSEYDLENISKKTQKSCRVNNLRRLTSSVFEQLFPFTDEFGSVVRLLRWIVKTTYQIQLKGITNLILDTLHDSCLHEAPEIINLLKKIRSLGINVIIFDEDSNLIKLGEVEDLISSDDHLNIIVMSLICKSDVPTSKSYGLHKLKSHSSFVDGEHDFNNSTLFRVPVWLEIQSDGSLMIIAKNIEHNQQLLHRSHSSNHAEETNSI